MLRLESFQNNLIINENAVIFWKGSNVTGLLGDGNEDVDLGNDYKKEYLEILFKSQLNINCIFLKEEMKTGQRIKSFAIELYNGDSLIYKKVYTTVGHHRLISFPAQNANRILIKIKDAKSNPVLCGLGVYHIPERLVEK